MPEQNTTEKIEKLIESLDTTKEGIRPYLEQAAEDLLVAPASGAAMKLACFRFIADTAKLDGALRQQAWAQFSATPGWFGNNASAGGAALELRPEAKKKTTSVVA